MSINLSTFKPLNLSTLNPQPLVYRVRLADFEGPLDLLLFFVRRDELDVHDIPIARITDEYLGWVRLIEEVDLDGAADFIYMAAVLVGIKARTLLPRPALNADGEPVDPRRELVERLLEYVRFKEAAGLLDGQHERRARHFTRGAASGDLLQPVEGGGRPAGDGEPTYRVSLFDLMSALRRVLGRAPSEPPEHGVGRESFTVEAQERYVLAQAAGRAVSFVSLVEGQTRAFVIATFLAVLELVRRQALRLVVGHTPDDFAVEATPASATPAPVPSRGRRLNPAPRP